MQALMLSFGLHLAVLALIHPMPSMEMGAPLVINARLAPRQQQAPTPAWQAPSPPDAVQPPPQEAKASPATLPAETLPVPEPAPDQQAEVPSGVPPVTPSLATDKAPPQATQSPVASDVPASDGLPNGQAAETGKPPLDAPAVLTLPSPIDTTWYLARQVDRHPKAIGNIAPQYPELARQRGQEGHLKLMVKIDELGQVRDVEVVEAEPPGVFDDAASEAFRKARFQPAMKDGRPVRYEAYMRVEFKLE